MKKETINSIIIIAIISVIIVIGLVFAYILSLIEEKEISLGENIIEVSLNENKSEVYLKIDNLNEG